MQQSAKLVVVTGCNKGIGYGIVENLVQKQYQIVMACRNIELANKARNEIIKKCKVDPSKLEVMQLDVSDSNSIDSFLKEFAAKQLQADILINNAAIATKGDLFNADVVFQTFKTNFYGTIELTEKFIPFIKPNGKIITIGSTSGHLKNIPDAQLRARYSKQDLTTQDLFDLSREFYESVKDGTFTAKGWPRSAYGTSKLGINMYARVLSRYQQVVDKNIQVYVCHPGYVNTDMTSGKGPLTIEQGCVTPIYLVELPYVVNKDYQGQFFDQKQVSTI